MSDSIEKDLHDLVSHGANVIRIVKKHAPAVAKVTKVAKAMRDRVKGKKATVREIE